eukprot:9101241-Alexandrium_andersonii.AAC.1
MGGRGPSSPDGPHRPLHISECAGIRSLTPQKSGPGGAALRAAPPALGSAFWRARDFSDP